MYISVKSLSVMIQYINVATADSLVVRSNSCNVKQDLLIIIMDGVLHDENFLWN